MYIITSTSYFGQSVVGEYIQPKNSLQIIQKLSFTNYRNAAVQYLFVFMDSE